MQIPVRPSDAIASHRIRVKPFRSGKRFRADVIIETWRGDSITRFPLSLPADWSASDEAEARQGADALARAWIGQHSN